MIPMIALMIGAYIITKMIALMLDKEVTAPVFIAAVITILVTLYSLYQIQTLAQDGQNRIQMLNQLK